VQINPSHKFIILASDGVWDFLSDEEAVKIVSTTNETDATKAAELLVIAALEQAAKESSNYILDAKSTLRAFSDSIIFTDMSLEELSRLRPGNARRGRHDDTTAVVLYL
jgi:hypothetical protein